MRLVGNRATSDGLGEGLAAAGTKALIRLMKVSLQCETDGELASRLGVSKGAVAQWRRRNSVPERISIRFQLLAGDGGNHA